ncbi:hypothetical protein ACH5RR_026193 [Cinchona calisaya]|uniref:Uncharacterized protein n=1 Tax=Cinchona calisaya TaxID=153742 RepID=A0ABD2Z3R4_9GENT
METSNKEDKDKDDEEGDAYKGEDDEACPSEPALGSFLYPYSKMQPINIISFILLHLFYYHLGKHWGEYFIQVYHKDLVSTQLPTFQEEHLNFEIPNKEKTDLVEEVQMEEALNKGDLLVSNSNPHFSYQEEGLVVNAQLL